MNLETFKDLSEEDKLGRLFFVRSPSLNTENYIYLGTRPYGKVNISTKLKDIIIEIVNTLEAQYFNISEVTTDEGTTVQLGLNLKQGGGLSFDNGLRVSGVDGGYVKGIKSGDKSLLIDDNLLSQTISLEKEDGSLILKGTGGTEISRVSFPEILKSVEFNDGDDTLIFTFDTISGDEEIVTVSLDKLAHIYSAGDGLQLDSGSTEFSVLKDPASDSFLSVSSSGVLLSGVTTELGKKQDILTPGTGISINNNVISVKFTEKVDKFEDLPLIGNSKLVYLVKSEVTDKNDEDKRDVYYYIGNQYQLICSEVSIEVILGLIAKVPSILYQVSDAKLVLSKVEEALVDLPELITAVTAMETTITAATETIIPALEAKIPVADTTSGIISIATEADGLNKNSTKQVIKTNLTLDIKEGKLGVYGVHKDTPIDEVTLPSGGGGQTYTAGQNIIIDQNGKIGLHFIQKVSTLPAKGDSAVIYLVDKQDHPGYYTAYLYFVDRFRLLLDDTNLESFAENILNFITIHADIIKDIPKFIGELPGLIEKIPEYKEKIKQIEELVESLPGIIDGVEDKLKEIESGATQMSEAITAHTQAIGTLTQTATATTASVAAISGTVGSLSTTVIGKQDKFELDLENNIVTFSKGDLKIIHERVHIYLYLLQLHWMKENRKERFLFKDQPYSSVSNPYYDGIEYIIWEVIDMDEKILLETRKKLIENINNGHLFNYAEETVIPFIEKVIKFYGSISGKDTKTYNAAPDTTATTSLVKFAKGSTADVIITGKTATTFYVDEQLKELYLGDFRLTGYDTIALKSGQSGTDGKVSIDFIKNLGTSAVTTTNVPLLKLSATTTVTNDLTYNVSGSVLTSTVNLGTSTDVTAPNIIKDSGNGIYTSIKADYTNGELQLKYKSDPSQSADTSGWTPIGAAIPLHLDSFLASFDFIKSNVEFLTWIDSLSGDTALQAAVQAYYNSYIT
ncbi:MAG: hypothetical protein EZS28_029958 [Streblomastix strix]|uniref:Uncharacterized protein n=1 Tax=Streblomastix strix TaxID=222440 RepID=A0A5J4UXP9_9EUKA|nr:MAG: hypothetical protein EZS28_029958 [Streblomastix strix]